MLTIFSTGKPFRGHPGMIQRNAIRSWMLLDPAVEVILFGDEDGAAEISQEFGFKNEREVKRSETGTKYIRHLFERAQQIAKNDILCYSNCDIILMSDFYKAVRQVAAANRPFLMVGRRTNTDVNEPIDFSQPQWEEQLRQRARTTGKLAGEWCADYFVFRRGLYQEIPELVNGRNFWDNWLIWRAHSLGAMVVDASKVVTAVHQNHDYGYHPAGASGVMDDPQTRRNFEIGERGRKLYTIDFATHRLEPRGIVRRWVRGPLAGPKRAALHAGLSLYRRAAQYTRPLRIKLGLRQEDKG
jgi:hypothetical protein